MTQKEIFNRIEEISVNKRDDEKAHSMEDSLYADFIAFVAERDDELGVMAKMVLTTKELDFARWYA